MDIRMRYTIIAAALVASVVAVPFVPPNHGPHEIDTTCTKGLTTTVTASSVIVVTLSASSEAAAVSSTTVEEHYTRKHHRHHRPHDHHHGHHHGNNHGHHPGHRHPSPSPPSSFPPPSSSSAAPIAGSSSVVAISIVPSHSPSVPAPSSVPPTPEPSSIIVTSFVPSRRPSTWPAPSSTAPVLASSSVVASGLIPSKSASAIPAPSSAAPSSAAATGWSSVWTTSSESSSVGLSSMPAATPSSSSQPISSSKPHTSSQAGATPFPYPSGTQDMGGWVLTYSAPTQTKWTAPSGNLITSEHVTSYTLTNVDSTGATQVTTTTTTEAACTAVAADYKATAVTMHSDLRANHSANPLVWDDSLACIAQRQANSCLWDHLIYVDDGGYGQNLAGGGGVTIASSIDMWYGEAPNYDPYYGEANPGGDFGSYGHFTQLVWAYSTSVGCATVNCGDGGGVSGAATGDFTVCNYYQAGNMGGEYGIYVLPPRS